MAIRIPILTSFDPKGLRQANAQFAKLQGSIGSLGRNFAVAGAAIAGAGAIIAKNAQALARIERINAQTAQTIQSMGNSANISAEGIQKLAGSLENLTATEAETIQEGTNLLLTFKNITNQAGAGNDIFNQTAGIMVDLARAMGTSASGEAIRLGKALNDPIRGLTALTRVGVSFTDEQRAQVKALQESGNLMGAQKIILAELQAQFGGSGAAFAKTFSGQLELMGHELGTIGEEATMSVMPALQGMVEQLRELIPVVGPQLKAAIESVDFVALGQAVVGFTTFLIENAGSIVKVTAAVFAINTAFKAMQVAIGIVNVALALKTWWLAKVATGMTTAAIATGAFSTALKLIPFVAIAAGIGLIIAGITETNSSYRRTTPVVTSFGREILKTGQDAEWAAGKYGVATNAINKLNAAAGALPKPGRTSVLDDFAFNTRTGVPVPTSGGATASIAPILTGGGSGAGGTAASDTGLSAWIATSKKEARVAALQAQLITKGLSSEVAASLTASSTPIKTANEALNRINKNGEKAVANLTNRYNQSAAGQQAAADAAAAAAQAAADAAAAAASDQANAVAAAAQAAADAAAAAAREMAAAHEAAVRAAEEAARAEAAALAERQRVFQSFQDSVKSTFAGIKDSILGAFDLRQLGGSTNAITRNMEKLLTRLRSFTLNVRNLAGMGLDPALLQQVISAGPIGGARLAASLVAGGASGLSAINAGFSEFGSLSSQIAATGTGSLFGQSSQQNIYNINVDGGVGSGSTIGKAIVDAIKAYERTSGAVWQGA
jgi:uncharacterized protein YdbL (DUF1318 family)